MRELARILEHCFALVSPLFLPKSPETGLAGIGVAELMYECSIYPHPSPLPKGEGTGVLAPFSSGRRVGDEGDSSLGSATPRDPGC